MRSSASERLRREKRPPGKNLNQQQGRSVIRILNRHLATIPCQPKWLTPWVFVSKSRCFLYLFPFPYPLSPASQHIPRKRIPYVRLQLLTQIPVLHRKLIDDLSDSVRIFVLPVSQP